MRRTANTLLFIAVVVLLAGCSDNDTGALDLQTPMTVTPPAESTPPPAPTSDSPALEVSDTVPAEEQAVFDAYRAFYIALDEAQADPQNSQDYLEPVATGAQFEQANGAIKANFLAGEESVGTPRLRPQVHSIEADTAVVRDCQDTTEVVRRDIDTKEPLVVGQDPDSIEATLTRVSGAWKVASTSFPEDPGAFC